MRHEFQGPSFSTWLNTHEPKMKKIWNKETKETFFTLFSIKSNKKRIKITQ